ncbi:ParB/RepB/Spo0J family partition protein [Anoxybacillus rupiensis]|uniref:ParB/RepB/Spo0J family partition protein n=1 Tax=Anoxybacteroides rupiense TaxID=311460 RepID=A0ABD5IS29_9BACL|nr:ParB/RepB/Spo0J family partition protein [Anoxybacillus rupiensis]
MIDYLIKQLKDAINSIENLDEKIEAMNRVRTALTEVSPFVEPVDCVRWVPADKVQANEYNPNKVASPEMRLLHTSIKLDGYTQPIVVYRLNNGKYEVVDGFHRNRVGKEYADIRERIHGYLPVVVIDKPLDERMGSTIRHNRARGTHQIRSMSDIVIDLSREGWSDEDICKKLGMELDEVIRLKQISGLKEAFANHEFSKSWEEFEKKYHKEEA